MLKSLEHLGRKLLIRILALLFGVARRPVELDGAPHILVVRLDDRVGNAVLLTPLLTSLRQRYPDATIDLLGHANPAALLAGHPAVDRFLSYRKGALLAADGPLRTPGRLRRIGYRLAIDAANPTDPSVTHAVLVRLSGATHTVGPDQPGFARLYSAPATIAAEAVHEIELRLALLGPLPGEGATRGLSLPALGSPPAVPLLADGERFAVVNVGARLATRRLGAEAYAALGGLIAQVGLRPVFTYGPDEERLAEAAAEGCPDGLPAPATGLPSLAALMAAAEAVISCDTGPMHLAVATGTPTCGIFSNTDPARYGYGDGPHLIVDARGSPDLRGHHREIRSWLAKRRRGTDPA